MSESGQDIKEKLDRWLKMLLEAEGSDLHLKSGSPIRARIKGDISTLSQEIIDPEALESAARFLLGDKLEDFKHNKEYDGAYSLEGKNRFRINIYEHLGGLAIIFRAIPPVIKNIDSLNLPAALHKLTKLRRGLILLTGSTGSGKSTTLASIINEINTQYPYHIISIEDPIEYTYSDKKSIIEQRELGTHTNSFAAALRSAMREDPDIIVVGEIRDLETAESILQAADSGHLVLSTLHTLDARETIERMVAMFPSSEQNRIRATLASTLEAVISQRLIKGASGEMIPAVEMMFKSPLIQELIRSNRENEILDVIEKEGISYDSIIFDRALYKLTLDNKITEEQAYHYATSPSNLKLMFTLSNEYKHMQKSDNTTTMPSLKEEESSKAANTLFGGNQFDL